MLFYLLYKLGSCRCGLSELPMHLKYARRKGDKSDRLVGLVSWFFLHPPKCESTDDCILYLCYFSFIIHIFAGLELEKIVKIWNEWFIERIVFILIVGYYSSRIDIVQYFVTFFTLRSRSVNSRTELTWRQILDYGLSLVSLKLTRGASVRTNILVARSLRGSL